VGKIEKAPNGDKLHQGLFDDNTMILSSVDMKVNKQSEALESLERGQVGIIPTDTVYGLTGDATNAATVTRILALKKRSSDKAGLPVLVSGLKMASKLVELTPAIKAFLGKVWPGKVSVVLPLKRGVKFPDGVAASDLTVALRWPKHRVIDEIFENFKQPLIGTSANASNGPNALSLRQALEQFEPSDQRPDFEINGGQLPYSLPSTIVRPQGQQLILIRPGAVSFQELQTLWRALV